MSAFFRVFNSSFSESDGPAIRLIEIQLRVCLSHGSAVQLYAGKNTLLMPFAPLRGKEIICYINVSATVSEYYRSPEAQTQLYFLNFVKTLENISYITTFASEKSSLHKTT